MKVNKDLIKHVLKLDQSHKNTSALYFQSMNGFWLSMEEVDLNSEMKSNINYLKAYFKKTKENLIINDEKKISDVYRSGELNKLFLVTFPLISSNKHKSFNWVKVKSLDESEIIISLSINCEGQLMQVINY